MDTYDPAAVVRGYLVSENLVETDALDAQPRAGLESMILEARDRETLENMIGEFAPFEGARKSFYYGAQEIGVQVDEIDPENDALYVVSYERDGKKGYAVLTTEQAASIDLEKSGYDVVNYRLDAIPERRINEPQAGFYGFIAHFADEYVINEGVADRPDTQRHTAVHELGHYHVPNFFMSREAYEQMTLLMTSTAANKEMPRTIREQNPMIPSFAEVYGTRNVGYLGQRS